MTSQSVIVQSSLAAGELSPDLEVREDVEVYYAGAEVLANFIAKVTGGAERRPGFEDLAGVYDNQRRSRLIAFVRSRTDVAILEFSHRKLRVLDRLGRPRLRNDAPVVVETPWTEDELDDIYHSQVADVVFITHRSHRTRPYALKRYPGDDWRLDPWSLPYGPFLPALDTDDTLTVAARTGATTIVSTAPLFDAPGVRFELRAPSGWHSGEMHRQGLEVTAGQEIVSDGKVYEALSAGECGGNQPIHERGDASDGAISFRYLHDGAAIARITTVHGAFAADCAIEGVAPAASPTPFWREPAFSETRGWPAINFFYEERAGLAGTLAQPDTVHLSVVGDYSPESVNFKPGTGFGVVTDADAVSRTFADGEVNEIVWAYADERLYVATTARVKRVSGPSLDEPITANPGGIVQRPVSTDGASGVRPAALQNALLYGSVDGLRIEEIPMDQERKEQRDLTVRADHVCASPPAELAPVRGHHVFMRREDGLLYCLTYARKEEIVAWARQPVGGGGVVESVMSLPAADRADQLYAVIRWGARRRICRLARPWRRDRQLPDEQTYLDGFALIDLWHAGDIVVTPAGAEPGDVVEMTVSDDVFAPTDVGEPFWLRAEGASASSPASWAPVRYTILAVQSPTLATLRLETHRPPEIGPTTRWAKPRRQFHAPGAAGEVLQVMADAADRPDVTLGAGGVFTLGEPAARVVVGRGYLSEIVSMPIAVGSPIGSARGSVKTVEDFTVIARDTVDAEIGVAGGRHYERLFRRARADLMGAPQPPKSGEATVSPPNDWARRAQAHIRVAGPYACTITAVKAKVTANV